MSDDRESRIASAFVSAATALVEGFDVVELLTGLTARCAELLDIASAGLLLADAQGLLHVMAASTEATRQVELFQVQREEGPCLECYRTGSQVLVADLDEQRPRWPGFVSAATEAGFRSLHALPLRLQGNILGALGLFGTDAGTLDEGDLHLAQALADVASVALVQQQVAADEALVRAQLEAALTSRITIEQAKGILAHRGVLDMDQAFAVLRRFSRDHNLRLTEVAASLVTRALDAGHVLSYAVARGVVPEALQE